MITSAPRSACRMVVAALLGVAMTACGDDPRKEGPSSDLISAALVSPAEDITAGRYAVRFIGASSEAPTAEIDVAAGWDLYHTAVFWHGGDIATGAISF